MKKIAAMLALLVLLAVFAPMAVAVSNQKYNQKHADDKIVIISGPTTKIIESEDERYVEEYYLIKKQGDPEAFPPIGIHLLKAENSKPEMLMGMLAGTGLTFNANFMTHSRTSLGEYLAKSYLVVGIDYRETNIIYDSIVDYSYVAALDLPQHTADVETAIKFAQEKTGIENYQLTGHSLGLYIAADHAAKHNSDKHLKHIYGIDMPGPLDPLIESELVQKEYDNYNASLQMLEIGQTISFEMLGFAQMIYAAQSDPTGDSGIPNSFVSGINFTNSEVATLALIYTNQLPGNEIFVQGFLAGDMLKGFYYTPEETIFSAGLQGTVFPTVINRDMFGIYANIPGSYQIQWQEIEVPFDWWNMELGMGNRPQAINLMRQAGNVNAHFHLKPNYAHADPVYAANAQKQLWKKMFDDNKGKGGKK